MNGNSKPNHGKCSLAVRGAPRGWSLHKMALGSPRLQFYLGFLSFSWRGKGPSYCVYIILCILPSFIITAFVPYPQGHGIKSGSWEALEREREAFTTVTASEFHPRLLRAALLRLSPGLPRPSNPPSASIIFLSCLVFLVLSLPSFLSLCPPNSSHKSSFILLIQICWPIKWNKEAKGKDSATPHEYDAWDAARGLCNVTWSLHTRGLTASLAFTDKNSFSLFNVDHEPGIV